MKIKNLKKKTILKRGVGLGAVAFGSVGTIGATALACGNNESNAPVQKQTIDAARYLTMTNFMAAGDNGDGYIVAHERPPLTGAAIVLTYADKTFNRLENNFNSGTLSNGDSVTISMELLDPTNFELINADSELTFLVTNLTEPSEEKPIVLSNFNMDSTIVKPIPPKSGIDYTTPEFIPWFDDGFNWQQFLGDAGVGNTLINNVMNQSDVVNLGFITATSLTALDQNLQLEGPVLSAFNTFVRSADNANVTIPAIGGVIPLWMANWTDGWGAGTPEQHQTNSPIYQFLNEIRNAGKDYVYSFGGWNHDSIAMDAVLKGYNAHQLKELYARIIDVLDLRVIDFDIEGTENGDTDDFGLTRTVEQGTQAKNLRMQALTLLKSDPKYQNLKINFTIPSLTEGLRPDDLELTIQAFKRGVIDHINIMAFDFAVLGHGTRTTLPGESAVYSMSATNALANELVTDGVAANLQEAYGKIAVTMMVGVQDTKTELWTITDQQLFTNFAINKGLRALSFWETNYDIEHLLMAANGGALKEGHTFGLWSYEQMLNGTGVKDSYATGFDVADFTYTNIAKRFNTRTLYDFADKNLATVFAPELLTAFNGSGVASFANPSAPTAAEIAALANTNFFFASAQNNHFATDLVTSERAHEVLRNEINNVWEEYLTNLA